MTRVLVSLGLLVLVYALALASRDPWALVMGAVIGGVLLAGSRQFLFGSRPRPIAGPGLGKRAVMLLPLAAVVVRDIVKGTWMVALVVLHLRPLAHPGIVAVPIAERTPLGVAVFGLLTTISPGSVLVDVDWEQHVMLFHVLDATDPDAVREDFQRFYRRFQRHVVP